MLSGPAERFRSSDGFVAGAGKRLPAPRTQRARQAGVLGIYRRAGHRSRQRTHTEYERDRSDANRFISSGSGDNKLVPKAFGAGREEQVLRAAKTWIYPTR